jgi:hypothetical protein
MCSPDGSRTRGWLSGYGSLSGVIQFVGPRRYRLRKRLACNTAKLSACADSSAAARMRAPSRYARLPNSPCIRIDFSYIR